MFSAIVVFFLYYLKEGRDKEGRRECFLGRQIVAQLNCKKFSIKFELYRIYIGAATVS